jgi:predicted MFS family arabinose efflux permease
VVAVPALVADDRLPRANSLMTSGQIVANEFIGPPLGAALFVIGAAVPVATDAGTLAIAGALLLSLPSTVVSPDQSAVVVTPRDALRAGLRLVWRSAVLRRLVVVTSILALVDAAWFALLALFVLDELGRGPAAFGGLLAAGAVGGLVGSLLADALGQRRAPARHQLVGALVVTAVAQTVLGLASSVVVVGGMLALSSGAFAVYNVAAVTVRQRVTARGTLGRVTTIMRTVVLSSAALGAAVGGVVAEIAGLRAPMLALAPLLLIAALVARRVKPDE